MAFTGNGDFAYDSTGNALLEFFSKAGSLYANSGTYYGNEASALELFKPAWVTNNHKAMQLAMWCRDVRGGAGNRSGFRAILRWLAVEDSRWVEANLHLVPMVGRWDDLEAVMNTPCEKSALNIWVRAIKNGNGLAAKWAPRENRNREIYNKLRKDAGMSPKSFRKLLVENTSVIETPMCNKEFFRINYSQVPSVAMSRYSNAFNRNDTARFGQWKAALEKGVDDEGNKVKVNASVLFPHDLIRQLRAEEGFFNPDNYYPRKEVVYYDSQLVNAQFAAMPNYMEKNKQRIMTICDFSGSMTAPVSGDANVQRIDVSLGLGLYCSDRLGKDNPFYRKFIVFSEDSKFVEWRNESFSVAVQKYGSGEAVNTNIRAALTRILEAGRLLGATNDQMPNVLLIVSDMQFDQGGTCDNQTTVETGLKEWEGFGYKRPTIVYWNVAGYKNAPAMVMHPNVAMISGFSPSILEAVFAGEDYTPIGVMNRAIAKYEVVDPV